MWHFISALCEIYQPLLDKLARNSIWTFEIQIKLSSSGFGCGHGSLMFFACMEHCQYLFLSNMIQLSHFTYLFFCCTNESIPTLSLKPAVNVAVTQSVSYQSTMMWGQVGNFYNVFLMIHELTVMNQQIILSTYRRLHLKEMHI